MNFYTKQKDTDMREALMDSAGPDFGPEDSPESSTSKAAKTAESEAPDDGSDPAPAAPEAASPETQNTTNVSFSGNLYGFLASRNISLAFTSYQTGVLYL